MGGGQAMADDGRGVPQADFLEDRFELTPAQARLVVHLTAGHSLRSTANKLGVKYESARTYLKSIFQKTGTHRQAELVLTVFRAMSEERRWRRARVQGAGELYFASESAVEQTADERHA